MNPHSDFRHTALETAVLTLSYSPVTNYVILKIKQSITAYNAVTVQAAHEENDITHLLKARSICSKDLPEHILSSDLEAIAQSSLSFSITLKIETQCRPNTKTDKIKMISYTHQKTVRSTSIILNLQQLKHLSLVTQPFVENLVKASFIAICFL